MTAQEFIKQYGWGKAKLVMSEWNNYFNQYEVIKMPTHYNSDLEIFVCEDDFIENLDSCVYIKDLEPLVDAWELVQAYGGYDLASNVKDITPLRKASYDLIENLKKAIELVDSVNENQD